METEKLKFRHVVETARSYNGGQQFIFKFENGYGASVVCHGCSYGGNEGLWELAVLDANGEIDYTTPITTDVEGRLTKTDVRRLLNKIKKLRRKGL